MAYLQIQRKPMENVMKIQKSVESISPPPAPRSRSFGVREQSGFVAKYDLNILSKFVNLPTIFDLKSLIFDLCLSLSGK